MYYWMHKKSDNLRGVTYKISDDVEVIVGGRPDYDGAGCTFETFKSIDGWMSVSDRFTPNLGYHVWIPWNESRSLPEEVLFGAVLTLRHWVTELGFKRIYLHCDAGTHRSVTIFGAYLKAFYSKYDAYKTIIKSATPCNRNTWSDPIEYIDSYIKEIPKYDKFIKGLNQCISNNPWGNISLEDYLRDLDEE